MHTLGRGEVPKQAPPVNCLKSAIDSPLINAGAKIVRCIISNAQINRHLIFNTGQQAVVPNRTSGVVQGKMRVIGPKLHALSFQLALSLLQNPKGQQGFLLISCCVELGFFLRGKQLFRKCRLQDPGDFLRIDADRAQNTW